MYHSPEVVYVTTVDRSASFPYDGEVVTLTDEEVLRYIRGEIGREYFFTIKGRSPVKLQTVDEEEDLCTDKELKLCAHCGGKADLIIDPSRNNFMDGKYAVRCRKCGIQTAFYDRRTIAFHWWNSRCKDVAKTQNKEFRLF